MTRPTDAEGCETANILASQPQRSHNDETMRCPYPDCQHEFFSPYISVGLVSCCPKCRRIAWNCNRNVCQASNRLLARYCRHCGKTFHEATRGVETGDIWRTAGAFDDHWYFPHPENTSERQKSTNSLSVPRSTSPTEQGGAAPVRMYDLTQQDGFRTPNFYMEMTHAQGLLAIHQGGGFLLLAQAFGDPAVGPVIVWSERESELVSPPEDWSYTAEYFRPFPPLLSKSGRYLIYSTPYFCVALDQWSLPGWAMGSKPPNRTVLYSMTNPDGHRLACPPVALGGTDDEIGFLLGHDGVYSWIVMKPADTSGSSESTGTGNSSPFDDRGLNETNVTLVRPLSLEGTKCQINTAHGSILTFATPRGHWLWNVESARTGEVDRLMRVSTAPEEQDFRLDGHVENRNSFRYARQQQTAEMDSRGRVERIDLHYSTSEDRSLEMFGVSLTTDPYASSRTRRSTVSAKAEPVGGKRQGKIFSMLFRADGRFLVRDHNQGDLLPIPDIYLNSGQIVGFQFDDPLLLSVSIEESGARSKRIDLLSFSSQLSGQTGVEHQRQEISEGKPEGNPSGPGRSATVVLAREDPRRFTLPNVELWTMPIVWSRWLFTCERIENRYYLVRREIPVAYVENK